MGKKKEIVFTDYPKRQIDFMIKVKDRYGLTMSDFFRYMITMVLRDDERMLDILDSYLKEKNEFVKRDKEIRSSRLKRRDEMIEKFDLSEDEVNLIYDNIGEEIGEL